MELKASVHANRLRHYKDPRDFRLPQPQPPPQMLQQRQRPERRDNPNADDDRRDNQTNQNQNKNEWHSVEKLKSKWMNNKRYYLVKWEDGSEPTWEPSQNIAPLLKQLYHSSTRRRKRKRHQVYKRRET